MAKRARRRSTGTPVAIAPTGESETVSISRIKNGYLITKSGSKRGKWYTHQEYSAEKPTINAARPPVAPVARRHRTPRAAAAPREVGFLKGSS